MAVRAVVVRAVVVRAVVALVRAVFIALVRVAVVVLKRVRALSYLIGLTSSSSLLLSSIGLVNM